MFNSANQSTYWNTSFDVGTWPGNAFSPIDYVNGRVYQKVTVTSKESTRAFMPQFCIWYGGAIGFSFETCADERFYEGQPITGPGTYYFDLGTPNGWWRLNGVYDWNQTPQRAQIMIKDFPTRQLVMSSACGAACFPGDPSPHDQITMSVEVIFVQAGSIFQVPGNWVGSPF